MAQRDPLVAVCAACAGAPLPTRPSPSPESPARPGPCGPHRPRHGAVDWHSTRWRHAHDSGGTDGDDRRDGCGARTRAGRPRRGPAVRGKARCRMHGGKSTGAPKSEKLKKPPRLRGATYDRYSVLGGRERAAAEQAALEREVEQEVQASLDRLLGRSRRRR